jgi:hypothetical protein
VAAAGELECRWLRSFQRHQAYRLRQAHIRAGSANELAVLRPMNKPSYLPWHIQARRYNT